MTRFLSLLLLLCLTATQAAAVVCPLATGQAEGSQKEAVHPAPKGHAAHGHGGHDAPHRAAAVPDRDTPPSPHDGSPAHHSPTGCAVAMACGTAALPASGAVDHPSSPTLDPVSPRDPLALTSRAPSTDTPPPRLAVRS